MSSRLVRSFSINAGLAAASNFIAGAALGYAGVTPVAAASITGGSKILMDRVNLSEPLRSHLPSRVALPAVAGVAGFVGNMCGMAFR